MCHYFFEVSNLNMYSNVTCRVGRRGVHFITEIQLHLHATIILTGETIANSVPVECSSIFYSVFCTYINILVYLLRTDLPYYYS